MTMHNLPISVALVICVAAAFLAVSVAANEDPTRWGEETAGRVTFF